MTPERSRIRNLSRSRSPAAVAVFAFAGLLLPACAGRQSLHAPSETGPIPLANRWAGAKFEGGLEGILRAAPSDRRFTALVDLTDQVDLDALAARLDRQHLSKASRRNAVVGALERVASRQQSALQPWIDDRVSEGVLDYARPLAIVNRLLVDGSAAGILALSARPEVAVVRPDWTSERKVSRAEATPTPEDKPLPDRFLSWAVTGTGADRMWDRGIDGRGVVVATIDTGIYEEHEQLAGRRLEGERGWFDPVEGTSSPHDAHGHGTGVLSLAVGANPEGRVVGVAPGAHWASALGNWHNYYSRSRMTLAADWILRVARPDVLVNAWSHDESTCSDFDLPFIRAWKASGIFVAFPSGNAGPASGSGESPAQLTGGFPGGAPVFAIAGLASAGIVERTSSRGPSRCGSPEFPSVAAPGADLPYARPGNPRGYGVGRGTSFAVGLAGGAAALLIQAVPDASPEQIERALVRSARDVAPPGRDDASGAGAIDLPAALAWLRSEGRP